MVYQMERQIWLNRGIWYRRHNKNLVVKNLSQNSVNNGYDSSKNILMYYFWAQCLAGACERTTPESETRENNKMEKE